MTTAKTAPKTILTNIYALADLLLPYATQKQHLEVLALACGSASRVPSHNDVRLALAHVSDRLTGLTEEERLALPQEVREVVAVLTRVLREALFTHPHGKFDKAKRFYLGDVERCECCNVRNPSRRWSNTENAHGRTAAHCALLFGVKVSLKDAKALDALLFPNQVQA